jgi:hypothetical protein
VDPREFGADFAKAFALDVANSKSLQAMVEGGMSAETLQEIIVRDLQQEIYGGDRNVVFPNVRAFLRGRISSESSRLASGMGQWDALVQAIGAATSAVITVTNNRKLAEIQKDAANAALAQQAAAAKQLELAKAAQGTNFQGPAAPSAIQSVTKYAIPAGIAATLLVGGYLLLR